jgi:hypothetical protein
MGVEQERHFPRKISQERMGMLSYGLMGAAQFGQRDAGKTIETSSGIREMQTFRKLPIIKPNKKKAMSTD